MPFQLFTSQKSWKNNNKMTPAVITSKSSKILISFYVCGCAVFWHLLLKLEFHDYFWAPFGLNAHLTYIKIENNALNMGIEWQIYFHNK